MCVYIYIYTHTHSHTLLKEELKAVWGFSSLVEEMAHTCCPAWNFPRQLIASNYFIFYGGFFHSIFGFVHMECSVQYKGL